MRHIVTFFFVAQILTPLTSVAQDAGQAGTTQSAQSDSIAAKVISISDLAERTGKVAVRLREADDLARADPDVTRIDENWVEFTATQAALVIDTDESLASEASDEQLNELLRRWEVRRQQLETLVDVLTNRIGELNPELLSIVQGRDIWSRTRSMAVRDSLPTSLVAQIDTVLFAIDDVSSRLRTRLDLVLEIDGRVTLENVEAVSMLDKLGKYQTEVLADRLSRRGKPLWKIFSEDDGTKAPSRKLRIVEIAEISGRYLAENPGYAVLHFGFFLVLTFTFRALALRLAELAKDDDSLRASAQIFVNAWLSAALIALIFTRAIYPVGPAGLLAFSTILSIPITIYLIRRQLPVSLHKMLYGLGTLVLFFVFVRAGLPTGSTIERLGMFSVATISLGSAAWFLRPGGATDVLELSKLGRLVIATCRTGLIILVISVVADVLGYVDLAHHGTRATMIAIYFGLYLYVGSLILVGATIAFIQTRLPQRSRTISTHTTVIQNRIKNLIFIGAGVYWLYVIFDTLGLDDPVLRAVTDLIGRPFGIGDVQISLIDFLAFFITLWISLKGAQIIRAILDEDILGRMELARGLPIAISGLTFYFLVALGFVFALSAAGVPLDRLALMTGALGIGIGFGLQDLVRNFISGLILMVERPVKVGDIIEFGTQSGQIMKIGIRSSIVRVWEGADVIVPNGHLVTNEVKNWTMADDSRRIDVNLTVDYDSDPETVSGILLEIGNGYDKVEKDPAPEVVFTGFKDRGLGFSLRCWVHDPTDWLDKRNKLSALAHKRLTAAGVKFPVAPIPGSVS
ncbi:MAG: mechanosensitive ion channel family protein [Rhodothermia bacterium]